MWIWEGTRRGRGVKLSEYITGWMCVNHDDMTVLLSAGDVSLRAATAQKPDMNDVYTSTQAYRRLRTQQRDGE